MPYDYRSKVMDEDRISKDVEQFILDEIDTVPHLEALLLFWNKRPQEWSLEEMAKALYVSPEATRPILADLERRGLVALTENNCFLYRSSHRDSVVEALDKTYRREVVRISNMIHSKPSASLREFARAFRLKRDRE
jgi:predicted ArsR family transcriptional regulator